MVDSGKKGAVLAELPIFIASRLRAIIRLHQLRKRKKQRGSTQNCVLSTLRISLAEPWSTHTGADSGSPAKTKRNELSFELLPTGLAISRISDFSISVTWHSQCLEHHPKSLKRETRSLT